MKKNFKNVKRTFTCTSSILLFTSLTLVSSYQSGFAQKQPKLVKAQSVETPTTSVKSTNYQGNRLPLVNTPLIKLPVTTIKPKGWLHEYLIRQKNGLTGNLGNISAWLQKKDNAWLSKDGKGQYGWEEVPYWLKGYANIGYILNDQSMIHESQVWLNGVLNSQREDGNFGPVHLENGVEDFWPKMIMLYCLQSYYEYNHDPKILSFMTKFFEYQKQYSEDKFLKLYWQGLRGGDNLHSVLWLYNQTGESWLLDLAQKIHKCSVSWENRNTEYKEPNHEKKNGQKWPEWFNLLPDWHNVNIAQGYREPATYYQVSHNTQNLRNSYDVFRIIREYFGQVPGGLFGSDEVARPGYDDPRQGMETCGMVEEMNSSENMLRITGDIFWADQTENVAFNSFPAATMADFKSLRYITSPNMVLNDSKNHAPGINNTGPFLMMNPFSSRCCQHNHTQGWPYFNENMWMATQDNGLAAVLYGANEVSAKVGNGQMVKIEEVSNYPFEENITFMIHIEKATEFPFYLRIPEWAKGAEIFLNNKKIETKTIAGQFVKLTSKWEQNDRITLKLPMKVNLTAWQKNKNSVSVNYGPLTFSLKIQENYIQKSSTETAIGDSRWQENVETKDWPSYEIQPASAWNYGLSASTLSLSPNAVKLLKKPWPKNNFPFTLEDCPISLEVDAKKIEDWQLDQYGLCAVLPLSHVQTKSPTEKVKLIPMGAARLRISSFPTVK